MTAPFTADNPSTLPLDVTPATVVRGEVRFTDELGQYNLPDAPRSFFSDYQIINHYERDKHRYMMGIASPDGFQGTCVAFVQLASDTLLWICDWTAMKPGEAPTIPDPDELGSQNWVLLDQHYEPAAIILGPDGVSPFYRISGVYVFGHKCPDKDNALFDITFPRRPDVQDNFTRDMPLETLDETLIDDVG